MRFISLVSLAAGLASAFPAGFTIEDMKAIEERGFPRDELIARRPDAAEIIDMVAQAIKENRENEIYEIALEKRQGLFNSESQCGASACREFDAKKQFVDVRPGSANQYVAPTSTDKRGPCPGLNSAANHGFLPHNGIPTIGQTIRGLKDAFGMGNDLSGFLAIYASVFNGDPAALTWSIGGSYKPGLISGLLRGQPGGISNSHNNYEGDSSVTRNDFYLNHGDAYSLNIDSFKRLLTHKNDQGLFTITSLQDQAIQARRYSIHNNPYFFSSPFAGVLVSPVAHYFIVRMMSNHTAENIDGYLDEAMLKTHFGITGEGDNLVWNPGQEKIPQNWYRRPSSAPYTIVAAIADVVAGGVKYPELLVIGGNTGTVDSFTGVDLADLTGGLFNAVTLLEGNNLGCFVLQAVQIAAPDILSGLLQTVGAALDLLNGVLSPILGDLSCPKLKKLDTGLYQQFPGATYGTNKATKRNLYKM